MIGLPFFKNASQNTNKFLILDINANGINCLAMYFDGQSYKIIGQAVEPLDKDLVRNGFIVDTEELINPVKAAVSKATIDLEESIQDVIVGVIGDLGMGIMTTGRVTRGKNDKISPKELEEFFSKISENSYIQAQNNFMEITANPDIELQLITSSNVYTKLDNVRVPNLEDKSGNMMEAAVFSAFSPSNHIENIKHIAKRVGLKIIAIVPELYSLTQWIISNDPKNTDFVLIDVNHDTTNMAVVFSGGIVGTKSISVGHNHFIEQLSEKMGVTFLEASKIIYSYIKEELSESEIHIVRTCINEALDMWLDGIELLFGDFSGVKTFPHSIYLTGIGMNLDDITDALETEPWTKTVPFKATPRFTKVTTKEIDKITDATGKINFASWIVPASLAIIYGEIFGENK